MATGAAVIGRLADVARGHAGAFVVAGTQFVNPSRAPRGLPVGKGAGFDGQFYYRLALDPLQFANTYRGIRLDSVIRLTRIGYPSLVWLASGGQASAVPAAAIIVNLVAVAALGTLCAMWVRLYGRHALWGLLPAGYFGVIWTVSRDLTELSAAAFMVAGIVAFKRDRFILAGLLLAAGALCRETALLLVAAVAVGSAVEWYRTKMPLASRLVTVVIAVVPFIGWQSYVRAVKGSFPIGAYDGNTGVPFVAMVKAVHTWLSQANRDNAMSLLEFIMVVGVVAVTLLHLRDSRAALFEKLAFGFFLLLVVSLSGKIWDTDPGQFRTFVELYVMATVIVLASRRRVTLARVGPVLLGVTWLGAAAFRIISI